MRTCAACLIGLILVLLIAAPALTGAYEVAKVYRDYPGYINPAVCDNPNLNKPAGNAPAAMPAAVQDTTPVAPAPTTVTPPVAEVPLPAAKPVVPAPAKVLAPTVVPPVADAKPAAPAAIGGNPPAVVVPAPAAVPAAVQPATINGVSPPVTQSRACCQETPYAWRSDNPVNTPYMTVWGGVVATNDVDADFGPYHGEAAVDNGYGVGVAAGYDFGPARVEIEGSYRNSNFAEGDTDLDVKALMVNAYADFQTGGIATPYLGAGVGYADVDIKDVFGKDYDDEVIAGQVGAGVLFAVSPRIAIDLGYRFMMTEDPEIKDVEFEVRQHTATLGVQVRF